MTTLSQLDSLDKADAEHVYLSGAEYSRASGDGLSHLTPLLILATSSIEGVAQDYVYLRTRFGSMGTDWKVDLRSRGLNRDGRMVETFRLSLLNGDQIDVHFDVTPSSGTKDSSSPAPSPGAPGHAEPPGAVAEGGRYPTLEPICQTRHP